MQKILWLSFALAGLLAACADSSPPAHTVDELVGDRILLDSVLIRCAQDREKARQDPECLNARIAAERLDAEERARRDAEQQARFERERDALRRRAEQAAEARRREEEAARATALLGTANPDYPVEPPRDAEEAAPAFGAPLDSSPAPTAVPQGAPAPAPAPAVSVPTLPLATMTDEQLRQQIRALQAELARRGHAE